ncbi:hydrogenase iron-sulfur subunit [Desulfosarcina sp. OttesenSCG-928-G10]|nr:hydrogenase iron-sulfur subunit [Desulfosarcina sp. OttesenSCG-928-G10]
MTQQTQTETLKLSTDVLVVGAGMTGVKAATEIAASGYSVTLIDGGAAADATVADIDGDEAAALSGLWKTAADSAKIEIRKNTRMDGATGMPGDFKVWLSGNDDIVEKSVGAIVIASELVTRPLNEAYGLTLSDRVLTQSRMEADLQKNPAAFSGKTIAFLVGLAQDGNPLVLERTLKSVLALQDQKDITAYVLTGDLKVAEDGLDRLYYQCRDKGALYIKLSAMPAVKTAGALSVTYTDPVLQRDVELSPDIIVVEEAICADDANAALAEMLRIDTGAMGFLQTDNVHRYPVSTNREGIFVAGGARRVKKRYGFLMDSENVALRVREFLGAGVVTVPADKAVIDTGKCTFCLTCYRCCPHGAIDWASENKPVISKAACQGCGICASECPMDAIQIGGYTDTSMIDKVGAAATEKTGSAPVIVAFCCQNSGLEAEAMARNFGLPLPAGLKTVAVPCAGKVDIDYVLHAMAEGADGVMVMACHNGNCKSERGSLYAKWRSANAQSMLEAIGVDKDRIQFATTASNMGSSFSAALMAMEATLKSK